MSIYVIKGKHTIPGFLRSAIVSWMIALTFISIVAIAYWIGDAITHVDLVRATPWPVRSILDMCGAYAGLSSICLYVTMWIYWIAIERSHFWVRIGWLFLLLLGLHYGALIYAFAASRGIVRAKEVGAVGSVYDG